MMLVGAGLAFGKFLCAKPTQTLVSYPGDNYLSLQPLDHAFSVLRNLHV